MKHLFYLKFFVIVLIFASSCKVYHLKLIEEKKYSKEKSYLQERRIGLLDTLSQEIIRTEWDVLGNTGYNFTCYYKKGRIYEKYYGTDKISSYTIFKYDRKGRVVSEKSYLAPKNLYNYRVYKYGADSSVSISDLYINKKDTSIRNLRRDKFGNAVYSKSVLNNQLQKEMSILYTHDSAGRIIERKEFDKGQLDNVEKYIYNNQNEVEETRYYNGQNELTQFYVCRFTTSPDEPAEQYFYTGDSTLEYKILNTFNDAGKIIKSDRIYADTSKNYTIVNIYDNKNNIIEFQRYNGGVKTTWLTYEYTYQNNRIVHFKTWNDEKILIVDASYQFIKYHPASFINRLFFKYTLPKKRSLRL